MLVDRAELAAAVKWVLPHVSKDRLLPVLCGVHVSVGEVQHWVPGDDGRLGLVTVTGFTVWATDRYTGAWATVPAVGVDEPCGSVLVSAPKLLPRAAGVGEVTVSVWDSGVSVTEPSGSVLVWPSIEGTFPDLARCAAQSAEGSRGSAPLHADTAKMGRFFKGAPSGGFITVDQPSTRLARFAAAADGWSGDHRVWLSGLLAPVSLPAKGGE